MPFKFHGGVHPNYMKAPDVPVTVIAPPPQVVLPMMQHIGAPCKPLVAVGDYVKMGQKIADNPAPVSAPIHATVSGKVIAIEPRPHPLGDMIPAIVIENDFQDTPCTDLAPLTPEQMKDPEAILDRIREAGIVGHGGAMFPTAFKIRGGLGKVDTLIINGAECEPYLNGDHLTMKNHPEELLKGIELARIASGLDKAYYGIEKNKQDAIDLLLSKNPAQYGVEIVPQAIEDAKSNAALNGITNASFFVGKAEEVLPEFYEKESRKPDADMLHPDVIVVDPPRKGCDEKCLETMLRMEPDRIVYVSCDPATLARDLKILCGGGYALRKVRPVDQFGHTTHVETVCLLSN